jgi:branched-subunit amino acid aminotransferase/4-amino-4-deoxychorismate lyase
VQVAFLDADQRLLGRRIEGLPSEVLAWRLHATASRPGTLGGRLDGQALKGLREVWFPQTALAPCEVHDRCRLRPGLTLRGPAVVEERGSTTVIGPDASFKLDAQGSIVIGLDQGSRFRCPRPPPFVWMDGDLVPWERATLHVASECVLRDGNVLGGICAYWSGSEQDLLLVRHAGHVARRRQGARIMRMTIPYTDAAIAAASLALIRACGYRGAPVHDRPVAYLDIGGLTDNRPEEIRTGFFILAFSKPTTKAVTEGVRSNVSTWGRNADLASPSRAKAGSNDHHSRLACIDARLSGFQIPILLNQAGRVAEGPGACFMIVRKGTLITPPVTPTSSRASPGRG